MPFLVKEVMIISEQPWEDFKLSVESCQRRETVLCRQSDISSLRSFQTSRMCLFVRMCMRVYLCVRVCNCVCRDRGRRRETRTAKDRREIERKWESKREAERGREG